MTQSAPTMVTVRLFVLHELTTVNNALYGSFLPIPSADLFPLSAPTDPHPPGALITLKTPITLNENRKRWKLRVHNTGDRPIQVGSHYPFLETNAALVFDRLLSYGTRLDIAAGTAVRFEPGETRTVTVVQVGGDKLLFGGSAIGEGVFAEEKRLTQVKERVKTLGFGHQPAEPSLAAELGPGAAPKMDREVVSLHRQARLTTVCFHVWSHYGR